MAENIEETNKQDWKEIAWDLLSSIPDPRRLAPEIWGTIAVIIISTYHVVQHMSKVEGNIVVAGIMGLVLGYLNGLFAFRFFEQNDSSRLPALVGLISSAAVSIWMQYAFYDTNANLKGYMLWGFNISAFVSGVWAPAFEIILGWLYGVRMGAKHRLDDFVGNLQAQHEKKLAEIHQKFTTQLSDNQKLLDQISTMRKDHASIVGQLSKQASELSENSHTETRRLQEKIDQLTAKIQQLSTDNAVLSERSRIRQSEPVNDEKQPVVKSAKKLTTGQRRNRIAQLEGSGELAQYTIKSLADALNAERSTIRNDLKELGFYHYFAVTENGNGHKEPSL